MRVYPRYPIWKNLIRYDPDIRYLEPWCLVQHKAAPECDLCVSLLKHECRVQLQVAKFESELGNPDSHGFEASSSDTLTLTRKRSIHQIAPQFHCEQLILAVLSDCHCGCQITKLSDCHCGCQITKPSVFSWLSKASNSNSVKRRRSRKKSFSDIEYPEVTSNMVSPSTTPSRKGSNLPLILSRILNVPQARKKYWLSLKKSTDALIRSGAIAPIDYNLLAKGIEAANDEHSAIAESHSSTLTWRWKAFAYKANTPEEMAKRFAEQSRVQQAHHDILQAQQEFINDLKKW